MLSNGLSISRDLMLDAIPIAAITLPAIRRRFPESGMVVVN